MNLEENRFKSVSDIQHNHSCMSPPERFFVKGSHETLLITEVEMPLKYTFVKVINMIKQ